MMVEPLADRGGRAARFNRLLARSGLLTLRRAAHLVLAAGATAMVVQFAANRSLWMDEAWLAVTIIESSFEDLLAPLGRDQVAPAGFLLLTKLTTSWFGESEYAFRLIPFAVGLLALPALFRIAHRILSPRGALVAVLFFVLAPAVIYYSSEVKPYGVDLGVSVLILVVALWFFDRDASPLASVVLAVTGATLIWISYPSVFTLCGVAVASAARYGPSRQWGPLVRTLLSVCVWIVSFLVLYQLTLRTAIGNHSLQSYWEDAFPPVDLSLHGARKSLEWLGYNLESALSRPFGFHFRGLAALVLFCGMYSMFRRQRTIFVLLIVPVATVLGAALVRAYPFADRLLLFVAPMVLLLFGEGFDWLWRRTRESAAAVPYMILALLAVPAAYAAGYHTLHPPVQYAPREQSRDAITFMLANHEPGDEVYVYPTAEGVFRYYQYRMDRLDLSYTILDVGLERSGFGFTVSDDWASHHLALERLQGKERVWIFLSPLWHNWVRTHRDYYVERLERMGERLNAHRVPGAEVFLYHLADPPP